MYVMIEERLERKQRGKCDDRRVNEKTVETNIGQSLLLFSKEGLQYEDI